jgi:hypothetical protein
MVSFMNPSNGYRQWSQLNPFVGNVEVWHFGIQKLYTYENFQIFQ